jgi:hypothetical protein
MLSFKQFMMLREAPERQSRKLTALPPVLLFKRRAIRLFPDGQEVGSYSCDQLKQNTFLFPNQY